MREFMMMMGHVVEVVVVATRPRLYPKYVRPFRQRGRWMEDPGPLSAGVMTFDLLSLKTLTTVLLSKRARTVSVEMSVPLWLKA